MQVNWTGLEVTPGVVGPAIHQFCEKRLTAAKPQYLPVRPIPCMASEYFHQTVAAQIEQEGGAARFGWLIREHPGMYLTANSYAVWQSNEGDLIDVTPNGIGASRILFADYKSALALNFTRRPETHFMRTFRPKTNGDYALEAALRSRGVPGQLESSDDDGTGAVDWTSQDHAGDPLAIAIDDFIMMSVCQNAMIEMTADGPVCQDPQAYELVSRTLSQCQTEMMRLWGQNIIRKADAQFLFEGAV